jgi:hypothetical protein
MTGDEKPEKLNIEKIKILVKLRQIADDVSVLKKRGDKLSLPVWKI